MSTAVTDDELDDLARAAARGDGAAFDAACADLAEPVWRYCLALTRDHELAVEAAQETFLRLVRAVRRYRGDGPFRVYTLVIARRAVAGVLRGERRRRVLAAAQRAEPEVSEDAAGLVALQELVAALPDGLRQAFVLTQLTGLTYDQAAQVAGCAVGTIRSRVFRARERLVAALQAAEEEHRDARP